MHSNTRVHRNTANVLKQLYCKVVNDLFVCICMYVAHYAVVSHLAVDCVDNTGKLTSKRTHKHAESLVLETK